jgi:hypothetical protein
LRYLFHRKRERGCWTDSQEGSTAEREKGGNTGEGEGETVRAKNGE